MLSDEDKRKLRILIQRYKADWRSDAREAAQFQIDKISAKDPSEASKIKAQYGYKDAKMDYKNFIDSVVGNIARKIEDEFNEKDHPRDKGGKFTSKGGEGKGGSKDPIPETESEKSAKEELSRTSSQEFEEVTKQLEETDIDLASMMEDLGIDTSNIPEAHLRQAFEEELLGNSVLTSKALKYIESYRHGGVLEANEDAEPKKTGK